MKSWDWPNNLNDDRRRLISFIGEDTQHKLPGELVASMSALNAIIIISPLITKPKAYEGELSPSKILKKSHVNILTIFNKFWQALIKLYKQRPEADSHVLVANGFNQCIEFQRFQDLKKISVDLCLNSAHFKKWPTTGIPFN